MVNGDRTMLKQASGVSLFVDISQPDRYISVDKRGAAGRPTVMGRVENTAHT